MKKIILGVMIVILCMITVLPVSAVTYLDDLQIPYATTAPTLDGFLSEGEWTAKFSLPASKTKNVVGQPAADFSLDMYMAWDENYLYVAYDVIDPTGGVLYFGVPGDYIDTYFDANGIAAANGDLNMHKFSTKVLPVCAEGGSEIVGFGVGYDSGRTDNQYHEINNAATTGTDVGCTGSLTKWTLEHRIAWADFGELLSAAYAGQTLPAPAAGMVITFMPSYVDYDANHSQIGWYIGQNTGVTDYAAAIPSCYGFRGTLASAPDQSVSPDTANTLSFGILSGIVAFASVSLLIRKKRKCSL